MHTHKHKRTLIVPLQRLGHSSMQHVSYIGLIDAHPIGDRSNDHCNVAGQPTALHILLLSFGHSCVVVVSADL